MYAILHCSSLYQLFFTRWSWAFLYSFFLQVSMIGLWLFLFCRRTCFHLLLLTSLPRNFVSAFSRSSLVVTRSSHFILRILLRHLLWSTSIRWSSSMFIFHVSHPYSSTGTTNVLNSLSLFPFMMFLELHIFWVWQMCLSPRFLLIFSPTCLASSFILVVLFCVCCLVEDKSATSSAKSRSSSLDVKFHLIPFYPFPTVLLIIQSIAIKNRNPDILHPCFTPVLMLSHASGWSSTAQLKSS